MCSPLKGPGEGKVRTFERLKHETLAREIGQSLKAWLLQKIIPLQLHSVAQAMARLIKYRLSLRFWLVT